MKILLDECCPHPLAAALVGHQVTSVAHAGFQGVSNGKLLQEAEKDYDVFITADKNMRYQQSVGGRRLAIIELPFNSWPRLRPLIASILSTLKEIKPCDYVEITLA